MPQPNLRNYQGYRVRKSTPKPYKSKTSKRKHSYVWGIVAEYLCAAFLTAKGYSIVKMRYRNHFGEIDIIAKKGKTIAFIEVKARDNHDAALYSVTTSKQNILYQSASGFMAAHAKYSHHDLRFDVMVVTSPIRIYHHQDAWRIQ